MHVRMQNPQDGSGRFKAARVRWDPVSTPLAVANPTESGKQKTAP